VPLRTLRRLGQTDDSVWSYRSCLRLHRHITLRRIAAKDRVLSHEPFDHGIIQPQHALKHTARVLASNVAGMPYPPRRGGQFWDNARYSYLAQDRILHLKKHLTRTEMLVIEDVFDVIDAGRWNAMFF